MKECIGQHGKYAPSHEKISFWLKSNFFSYEMMIIGKSVSSENVSDISEEDIPFLFRKVFGFYDSVNGYFKYSI